MILPSIDLLDGHAVQLVGGETMKLDAGDPLAVAERFGLAGELAVVDLDAAFGRAPNEDVVGELCRRYPCRVGGGIRSVDRALELLDLGALKVVLGTAAIPELLRELPRDRTVVALDSKNDEVVVDGWRERTGRTVRDRMAELREFTDGFLVTFVEREGRLEGTDLDRAGKLVEWADGAEVTIAGGVTTAEEVAALDALGCRSQVGMALYEGTLDLGAAIAAPLRSDRPDGLWPTLVVDESDRALGLVYSNEESLRTAVAERRGVYWSRTRGLWRKGESSGAVQELLEVRPDCDRDALRFRVRQQGAGFCHRGTQDCFGGNGGLALLERTLRERLEEAPSGSYTRRLFEQPELLRAKLSEEALELGTAESRDEVVWEAADLLYFTFAKMAAAGVDLREVESMLDRRARQVRRRDGSRTDGGATR